VLPDETNYSGNHGLSFFVKDDVIIGGGIFTAKGHLLDGSVYEEGTARGETRFSRPQFSLVV